jgi:hypothetical protein
MEPDEQAIYRKKHPFEKSKTYLNHGLKIGNGLI